MVEAIIKNNTTENTKSWYNYAYTISKVLKDKCYYSLFNFDLFTPVDRIYPSEGYYGSFYTILLDADKITNNIYLGSAYNAADYEWLCANKIDIIVNVTECISNYYENEFKYYNYSATDLNNSSLNGFYQKFHRLVVNNPTKNILVHCYMGKSRSASLVLYYLMKEYNWNLERALKYLKRCRPCININTTFITEIINILKE